MVEMIIEESNKQNVTVDAQAAKSSPIKAQASENEAQVENPSSPAAEAVEVDASKDNKEETSQEPENFDATVRVAKDSSVRKLISFVMYRLERGGVITVQALNICVQKAVLIALISRDRLGNIHQVNSLLVVQEGATAGDDESKVRTTSGIQIILSKNPLDANDVGYEKPKPKGFASHTFRRRQDNPNPRRLDDSKVVEIKASTDKVAVSSEKNSYQKRQNRRKKEVSVDPAPDNKEVANNQHQSKRSRRPKRKASVSAEKQNDAEFSGRRKQASSRGIDEHRDARDAPDAEQEDAATTSKSKRKNQRRSRPKADEKEKSESVDRRAPNNSNNQGKRAQSKRDPPAPQVKNDTRTRSSRGGKDDRREDRRDDRRDGHRQDRSYNRRNDRDDKKANSRDGTDVDYMGRVVPRNSRRQSPPENGYMGRDGRDGPRSYQNDRRRGGNPQNNGGQGSVNGNSYHRRGAPYEVGQSYRYMPNFREERDPYFTQYQQGVRGGGNRGRGGYRGGDQPRPGYYPASRNPQRPEELQQSSGYSRGGYEGQQMQQREIGQRRYPQVNGGGQSYGGHRDM